MPLTVAIYKLDRQARSEKVCAAMAKGIDLVGDVPTVFSQDRYRTPTHDVAVFYGYVDKLPRIMSDYRGAGKHAVYVDLGYWRRKGGEVGKWDGYHKVVVNGRHPTGYFQNREHDFTRAAAVGWTAEKILPWQPPGDKILIAGMSQRAAEAEGFRVEQWEKAAIETLLGITDRPIVYRPKPSWKGARPLLGAEYSAPAVSLENALLNCHAVVTHHSNVAVDAILAGIPAFCDAGVALPLARTDLLDIECPIYPSDREQWLSDIAWCQWSVPEMALGLPWRHLKDEGLIP